MDDRQRSIALPFQVECDDNRREHDFSSPGLPEFSVPVRSDRG